MSGVLKSEHYDGVDDTVAECETRLDFFDIFKYILAKTKNLSEPINPVKIIDSTPIFLNLNKVQEKIVLTGWTFVPVAWDDEQKKYVDIKADEQAA